MTKSIHLGSRLRYPITIVKLLKSPGDDLQKREPVFEYRYNWVREITDENDETKTRKIDQTSIASFVSPAEGKLKEWFITAGTLVPRDTICFSVDEVCSHEVQFQGLCGICGKDMTERDWSADQPDAARAPVNMTHDNTGLTVSSGLAVRAEHAAQKRLLEQRKLSLVVDLDQTIIHACIEPTIGEWQSDPTNPNHDAVKEVRSFQLNDDGPRGLASGCWYYIKMRPGLAEFLEAMADIYEMHVYTMGTRAYALNIAKLIDPDMKYFGNRVISRDENGNLISKNLQRIFPVSTDMVVIIDDRSDVWPRNRPNLVKVTPYDFFKGIGDINSSFLPKRQDMLPAAPIKPKATNGSAAPGPQPNPTATDPASANDSSTKASPLADLISMGGGGQDKALQLQQTAEQEKFLEKQITERPLLHMQEELDKDDEMAQKMEEAADGGGPTTPPAERHHVLRDDDEELTHVKRHLTELHRAFYKSYDEQNRTGKVDLSMLPDAGYILDEMKAQVLRGAVIVLSGLVPLNVDVRQSEIGLQIRSFGGKLRTKVSKSVTHLVVSTQRPRTEKLREAAKIPSIKIVNQYWLMDCLSQWKRLDEMPYLMHVRPSDRKKPEQKDVEEVSDADEDEDTASKARPTLTIIDESGRKQELEYDENTDENKENVDDDEEESDSEAENLVVDFDHVMPTDLPDGARSPIDDLKSFDWDGVDDELAEFLGSDAEDSDDEGGDDDGEDDDMEDTDSVGLAKTVSTISTGKRKSTADNEDDDDLMGEEETAGAKRQKLTNGRDDAARGGDGGDKEASAAAQDLADLEAEMEADLEADLLAELEAHENG